MRWISQSLPRVGRARSGPHALAVEGGDHLVVAELLRLERAAVPDRHRARAVLALRDLALELEVLERVVLGVHREPVLVRVVRDAARKRPRGQRPSCSSRRSQCRRRAWCSWTTKRAALSRPGALRLPGLVEVALGAVVPSLSAIALLTELRRASGVSSSESHSSSIEPKQQQRAGVEQLGLGEAAGEHGDGVEPGPLGGLAVPGRVAHHHGLAPARLLDRRLTRSGSGFVASTSALVVQPSASSRASSSSR